MSKIWLHGEVVVKKMKGAIPDDAKVVKPVNGVYIIADSETTGNHHLLEEIAGVELYEKDGMFYLKTDKKAVVRCVDEKRHDTITVDPCEVDEIILFDKQQEVDHLTDEVRSVRD